MKEEGFEGMVKEALQLPNATVENLGFIGGMTNKNYLVEVDGKRYVVRIPGNATSSFINREQEFQNLTLGSALGLNPALIHFNSDKGLKITQQIENANPIEKDKITPQLLENVAKAFRTLHHSKEVMATQFTLFTLMDDYESLVIHAGSDFYDGFEEVKKEVKKLQVDYEQFPVTQTPCHIDPACANFLVTQAGKLYLIDWEYGGMFDPLWDVAAFTLEAELSSEKEKFFHRHYFQRAVTDDEQKRLKIHQIFQDYLWSLWTLFKESNGDDFGGYGLRRFERMKANIQRYKTLNGPNSSA